MLTPKFYLSACCCELTHPILVVDGHSGNNQESIRSSGLKIPLPPLATQQAIVAEIEAEQALVAANRELIARFEKKIQATLARVWGEDETAATEPYPARQTTAGNENSELKVF